MAINIRPFDSNLRSSSSQSYNSSGVNSAATNKQINKIPSKLSISSEAAPKVSSEQSVKSDRQRVVDKTSSQLFSSAATLTSRTTLTESLARGVDQLTELAYKIKDEVDPTKKEDLIDQANDLVSSLETEYNEAVNDDPNLASDVSITSLVRPGEDYRDGSKFAQVLIEKVTSPNSSGISSLDFSDIDEAISTLEDISAIYSQKQISYENSASEIAGATKRAITELEAKSVVEVKDKEAAKSEELADEIAKSTENLLAQNSISEATVQALLSDDEDEDTSENEESEEAQANNSSNRSSAYRSNDEDDDSSIEFSA